MTEQELEILRQKAKALSATVLMEWSAEQLRLLAHTVVTDPQFQRRWATEWRRTLQELRAEYQQIVFPECPPEMSDLYAAEFQEAFDDAVKRIEKILIPAP
jgi:hypothetical protein